MNTIVDRLDSLSSSQAPGTRALDAVVLSETASRIFANAEVTAWVTAAQNGDRQAFENLVARFEASVQANAYRRLGNWEEAVDLSQDVFFQAFRRLDQLLVPEAFGGWLKTMTVRMCINRSSRRRKPIAIEQETLEATCVVECDPLDVVLASERCEQLNEGLQRLSKMDRQTLEAFYMRGQSLIEMADAFDAPIGTIKRRLHTARKRLATLVDELQAV